MKIVIGNKNYSTWSLRGWLALKQTGAEFTEVMVPLDTPNTHDAIRDYSSARRVPVLIDGSLSVWDRLAIVEYLAERFPQAGLWPADREARAHARAVVAEMHSGFTALRGYYPMNIRRVPAARSRVDDVEADVARIVEIWREMRTRFGAGGFPVRIFQCGRCVLCARCQ